jgi:quinol-cytochrome oxidoreductase complex cytochrome b subunit
VSVAMVACLLFLKHIILAHHNGHNKQEQAERDRWEMNSVIVPRWLSRILCTTYVCLGIGMCVCVYINTQAHLDPKHSFLSILLGVRPRWKMRYGRVAFWCQNIFCQWL